VLLGALFVGVLYVGLPKVIAGVADKRLTSNVNPS
jgi:hypothetical protein